MKYILLLTIFLYSSVSFSKTMSVEHDVYMPPDIVVTVKRKCDIYAFNARKDKLFIGTLCNDKLYESHSFLIDATGQVINFKKEDDQEKTLVIKLNKSNHMNWQKVENMMIHGTVTIQDHKNKIIISEK